MFLSGGTAGGSLWHTFWFLIRKNRSDCRWLCRFKDVSGTKQEVEIGYGLGKEFEQQRLHDGSGTFYVRMSDGTKA